MTARNSHLWFWLVLALTAAWFIYLISPILMPFLVGIAIAYLLDPLTDRLQLLGLRRSLATSLVVGLFFALIILAVLGIIPLALEQLIGLAQAIPGYIERLREELLPYLAQLWQQFYLDPQGTQLENFAGGLTEKAQGVLTSVLEGMLQSGLAVANVMGLLVITPVVTFYLLRDWDAIVADIDDLLPRDTAPTIRAQFAEIDRTLSGFLRGQLNVMLTLAALYSIGLSLVGLNYALIIALVSGVMVIIPFVGTILSGALALGVAYIQFGTLEETALVLGIFVVGQVLEAYVLTPKLVGRSVGLNPLWIIFGMMAGGAILGFVGILLAVPITAVCGVLSRFALVRYRHSSVYRGHDSAGES